MIGGCRGGIIGVHEPTYRCARDRGKPQRRITRNQGAMVQSIIVRLGRTRR